MITATTSDAFALWEVSRSFRYFRLDNLSLSLPLGQIMGLVGPNGAGKSTTIRLLMGLIAPESGSVELLGRAVPRDVAAAKRDVAFVADDMRLYGTATLGWHMKFIASMYPGWDAAYAAALLKRFNLHADQMTKGLSRGEHVKALLLLALARRPRLLVLDEPTSGLDPVARHELLAELMEIVRDESRSILFSSHNTLDVERICDQIAFIDRGELVEVRDKESFLERWRRLTVEVPVGRLLPELPGMVDMIPGGRIATLTTDRYSRELEELLAQAGLQLGDVQRLSLEEIFVASVLRNRQEDAS
jgi:ABC-2 type transport system ATP-binding protein